MNELVRKLQAKFSEDFTLWGLKSLLIVWALIVIVLAIVIDNKWILAGLLAYEILP